MHPAKVKDKEIDPLLTSLEPEVADDDPFDDAADLNDLAIVPTEPIDPNTIPDEHRSTEAFDQYIAASILFPQGGEQKKATVMRRRINPETGFPVGVRNSNPILDTREYEVQFPDGSTDTFTANLIAKNLYAQVDDEGRSYQDMREIIRGYLQIRFKLKITVILVNFLAFCRGLPNLSKVNSNFENLTQIQATFW
jgi:hypothetical protein